jgi:hypothetical protein
MKKFSVTLPIEGEYLTTVRLTTGGLCALAGFDVDSAEDYKVCVTESLLILKRNGFLEADIQFTVGETLGCTVTGKNRVGETDESLEGEISKALLSALIGKVDFTADENGKVLKIAFEG